MADINTYEKLRNVPIEELIGRYDQQATHTSIGLSFLREEIARRDAEKQSAEINALTRQMRNLTWVITGLTAINAFAAVLFLLR